MKFPSSTSTTPFFSLTTVSCMDSILRRLLCGGFDNSGTIPGDPHHPNGDEPSHPKPAENSTPSVVARLMGLDDLPAPRPSPSSALRRFLDIPTFLTQENDEFLLLSFGTQHNKRQTKHNNNNNNNNKTNAMEMPKKIQLKKKKNKNNNNNNKRVEPEDPPGWQNSSPVSVLDCPPVEFADVETTSPSSSSSSSSSEETANCRRESRRRKLSSQLGALEISSAAEVGRVIAPSRKGVSEGRSTIKFSDVWREVCKLADGDANGVNWAMGKLDLSREMVPILGSQIMDALLQEVVTDLCRICKL